MNARTRGNAGEAMVLAALVKRGFHVLVPFGDGHPLDLVVSVNYSTFVRVQCKTAWIRGGCLIFNCRSTDHGRGPQAYVGLADVFGVYLPSTEAVYLVPVSTMPGLEGRLRLKPTRNNQRKRVRFAAKYEIDRWTPDSLAAVA